MKEVGRIIGMALAVSVVLLIGGGAFAQDAPSFECDNNFGDCGTPEQSGGGSNGGGGAILVNNTDLGDTYQYADDYDDDGIEDPSDNCVFVKNPDQADDDGDGVGSSCDNCPTASNENQSDLDADAVGDACDDDMDGDGVANGGDLCPQNPDPQQSDKDGDELGDACDDDMDDDGITNLEDNCPAVKNPDQSNADLLQWGDECNEDDDGDGIRNTVDKCPQVADFEQEDLDGDGIGDLCDSDKDNDGVGNLKDNCPTVANKDQSDLDRDSIGEACDDAFCYVVEGDKESCLDPNGAFAVHSPNIDGDTGDTIRLRLFANRQSHVIQYSWQIVDAPSGSSATIKHPSGEVSLSTPLEYHYSNDGIVSLRPDKPGTYEIIVTAEMIDEDAVTGLTGVKSEATAFITVEGKPLSEAGCSVTSVGAVQGSKSWFSLLPLLLIGLGFVFNRRK